MNQNFGFSAQVPVNRQFLYQKLTQTREINIEEKDTIIIFGEEKFRHR